MTTIKHLQLIKERCEDMIEISTKSPESFMPTQIAAYKSTIAAINCLNLLQGQDAYQFASLPILAAWPIELLKP